MNVAAHFSLAAFWNSTEMGRHPSTHIINMSHWFSANGLSQMERAAEAECQSLASFTLAGMAGILRCIIVGEECFGQLHEKSHLFIRTLFWAAVYASNTLEGEQMH